MGLQIPYHLHSQVPPKNDLRGIAPASRTGVPQVAQQKESRIEEGHLLADHVHMLISIPPKYAASQVVGFIKGKSAIHLARVYGEKKRNFVGQQHVSPLAGKTTNRRAVCREIRMYGSEEGGIETNRCFLPLYLL
jgi:REP element-mobilizing transposase RayT